MSYRQTHQVVLDVPSGVGVTMQSGTGRVAICAHSDESKQDALDRLATVLQRLADAFEQETSQ